MSRHSAVGGYLRAHAGFLVLLALAAPLLVAFAWQPGLATFNDDSFSYITLARWIRGTHTFVEEWAWQHAHFPPLFPLLLVATGSSTSLPVAHVTVALCAVAALVALYAYGLAETRSRAASCLLVVAFLATPTAWLGEMDILSEPLFLAVSLAALRYHSRHLAAPDAAPWRWLVFGAALAAAHQTRSAAWTLLAACGVHALLRAPRTPAAYRLRLLLPFVVVAAVAPLWPWLRPGDGSDYQDQIGRLAARWLADPAAMLEGGAGVLMQGWVASFQAEGTIGGVAALAILVLAAVALAGALRRAAHNRIDGWYVLGTLALLVFWNYGEETARRLLYPVVPLMLLHAGEMAALAGRRIARGRYVRYAVAAAAALLLALCAPAMALLAMRASERTPLPSASVAYANVLEYYRSVNEANARVAANPQLAALIGMQALRYVTEPGAGVMWMRPEYIAILGERRGVPYEYSWDKLTLARALDKTGARYLVLSEIYKLDVAFALANPAPMFADLDRFSDPVVQIVLPVTGRPQFVLRRVDAPRLRAYLEGAR